MWLLYALLGAVGKSYSGFFRKKLAGNISGSLYLWVASTFIVLVLTPFMIPQLPSVLDMLVNYPLLVFGATVSAMLGTQLNLEALKREELSYTAPLNAFVPIFTVIIASIFLDENLPRYGFLGIVAIVVGAYVVNIKPGQVKWYEPLRRMATSTGAQLSIGVALGFALNTILIKAVSNEGYEPMAIMYATTTLGWLLLMHVPFRKRTELKTMLHSSKFLLFFAAASTFASSFFHILAVSSTYASYAVSIRRLDAVIAIGLGWRYLKETDIRYKLIGSLIMTAGAVLIALS